MLHICLMGIMLLLQINTLDVFNKSENIKDNSISVEPKKIEPNNIQTSDTFFASFNSERTSIFNILLTIWSSLMLISSSGLVESQK